MSYQHFLNHGFALVPEVLSPEDCHQATRQIQLADENSAGSRSLLAYPWCRDMATKLRQVPALASVIPEEYIPVQCTYFEKSIHRNWIVSTHQDLSIPVKTKVEHPQLHGWSHKEGGLFVQGPPETLEQLIAVRVHLDPCTEADGPVRVFSGSHHLGRIDPAQAAEVKARFKVVECTSPVGGALVMRPLLLHASSKASGKSLRRVLHFLFGPPQLPFGLEWG